MVTAPALASSRHVHRPQSSTEVVCTIPPWQRWRRRYHIDGIAVLTVKCRSNDPTTTFVDQLRFHNRLVASSSPASPTTQFRAKPLSCACHNSL
jgi:hypothetical protein